MRYGVIAAGAGSRLVHDGIGVPKPLVNINGIPMIDRLIQTFMDNGATGIDIICNEHDTLVGEHLHHLMKQINIPMHLLTRTTPSSMHSFCELSSGWGDGPFVVTTVDTIFQPQEFAQYISTFEKMVAGDEADGLMAVTDYIDDESPLYVKTDDTLRITAFQDTDAQPHYISGGIYGLTSRSLQTLHNCIARGESRMRNFQRALISDGLRLKAYPFTKILDIDHARDIEQANRFLA